MSNKKIKLIEVFRILFYSKTYLKISLILYHLDKIKNSSALKKLIYYNSIIISLYQGLLLLLILIMSVKTIITIFLLLIIQIQTKAQ